jgi:hypothetical protein
MGHSLCHGSAGLCHHGPRLHPSNLLPNLGHLSCISGQALYMELEKGKVSGTRRRTGENHVKKPFLSILRVTRAGCRTSRPTKANVSFSSRHTVATREHVSSAPPPLASSLWAEVALGAISTALARRLSGP